MPFGSRGHRQGLALTVLLVTFGAGTGAQTPTAVTGIVRDQTGAVLQSATVELVPASGAALSTTTNAAGVFRFENVAPGQYELRAVFEGFSPPCACVSALGRRHPRRSCCASRISRNRLR